jgi:hypothetical protein
MHRLLLPLWRHQFDRRLLGTDSGEQAASNAIPAHPIGRSESPNQVRTADPATNQMSTTAISPCDPVEKVNAASVVKANPTTASNIKLM